MSTIKQRDVLLADVEYSDDNPSFISYISLPRMNLIGARLPATKISK